MSPGYITTNTRGGALYASRLGGFARHTAQAPGHVGRDFGARAGRAYGAARCKFVMIEDEESGLVSIETQADETVEIKPTGDGSGGLTVTVKPPESTDDEPAAPLAPMPLG